MTLKKTFLNCVLVGFGVVFLMLTVVGLFNDVSVFGGIFLLGVSIVCTLGLSLILWVPLWWLTGWIILTVFLRAESPPKDAVPKRVNPLITYIQQARSRGYSDEQIQRRLLQEGWTADDVETAFNPVR